jgi:O-antigen ligase
MRRCELNGQLMKYVIFIIGLLGIVPLIQVLRSNRLEQPWVWILLGFFPFLITAVPYLNLSVIGWPVWPGHVKGFQITALDLYALAIYVTLPRPQNQVPFRFSMAFYFSAILLSIFWAQVPFAAGFYAWQLVRMFLVYVVVTKACAKERNVYPILIGMAAGLCMEACMAIWERFGLGILQTSGSLGHQNLLGLLSHFIVFPFFALLLAGQRGRLPGITMLAGLTIWALTASRATLGLGGFGLVALFIISALRKWTSQKARVLLFGSVMLVGFGSLAISSLNTRFAEDPLSDTYDERAALNEVAASMLSDRPMGFGANNFTVVANTNGYFDRSGVAWTSRNSIAHNIYWLAAAETGYFGIIALVVFLLHPLIVALRCGWRNREDRRGDLLLGIGMGLLIVYIHSYFEFNFVLFDVQYVFAIMVGLVAGLATQLGYWRRPYTNVDRVRANRSAASKALEDERVL